MHKQSFDEFNFLEKKLGDDYLGIWLSVVFEFLCRKKIINFSKEENLIKNEIKNYVKEMINKLGEKVFNNILTTLNNEDPGDIIGALEMAYSTFPNYAAKLLYEKFKFLIIIMLS